MFEIWVFETSGLDSGPKPSELIRFPKQDELVNCSRARGRVLEPWQVQFGVAEGGSRPSTPTKGDVFLSKFVGVSVSLELGLPSGNENSFSVE